MKVFVIFLILIGFTGIAFAESNTGESVLAISTPFNSYVSGDKVYVYIDTNPNSNVTINVTDPSSNTVEEILATSDEDGRIFTSFFLPVYSELGTWIMNATYDVNFDTTEFEVVRLQKDRMVNDILTLEKYSPIREPFAYSDHVLVGTILQKENVTENTLNYSIDVDFYLKNEQSFDFLTATFVPVEKTYYDIVAAKSVQQINSPFYFEGDVVFVYLKNNDGKYEILPQSFVIDKSFRHGIPRIVNMEPIKENFQLGDTIIFSGIVQKTELYQAAKKDKPFDITLTIHDNAGTEIVSESLKLDSDATYEYELPTTDLPVGKYEYEIDFRGGNGGSLLTREITLNPSHDYAKPIKQIESGVSVNEIQCKQNLVLIQKYDGSPACVTESTKQKLIERGWTGSITESEYSILRDILDRCEEIQRTGTFDGFAYGSSWQNETHYIDNNSCRWIYLEKYLDENNELNFALKYDNNGMIIDDLQRIYDYCDYSGKKPDWYFSWNNQTHHIDSKQCKWYGCDDGEIYYRGVCMTPEAKEKAQSVGEFENEN